MKKYKKIISVWLLFLIIISFFLLPWKSKSSVDSYIDDICKWLPKLMYEQCFNSLQQRNNFIIHKVFND